MRFAPLCLLAAILAPATVLADPDKIEAETTEVWSIEAANQGVGVDAEHFYAVDNQLIVKFSKETGEEVARWDGKGSPIRHLDSAALIDGLLYAANSNYPEWPMTSTIEVWDPETMEHVDTHSFGIYRGSLTWLDRHDGYWWATFANYNRVMGRSPIAYGNRYATQMVKMDDAFRVLESWVFPEEIIDHFGNMSNSGGSWGPDGRLYITGHDDPEVYALELPEMGPELVWVGTIGVMNTGQGFAWDRSAEEPTIYAIIRGPSDPENKVTVNVVDLDGASWTSAMVE